MTLTFLDFAIIAAIVVIFAGGGAAASAYLRPPDRDRFQRIEQKLDLIMTNLKIDYTPPPYEKWQEIAKHPHRKIEAIKAYRDEHGAGLAEAKKAVEDFTDGR